MHVLIPLTLLPVQALWFSRLPPLYAASVACVCIVLFGAQANSVWATLTQRMKWIVCSIALLCSWFTPGEYVPGLYLTYEGLWQAGFQTLQLLAMLALVSLILQHYSATQLISGLYQGLAFVRLPKHWLQAMVVRLFLVLQSQQQPLHWRNRDWPQLFDAPEQLLRDAQHDTVTVQLTRLRLWEKGVLILWLLLSMASVYRP